MLNGALNKVSAVMMLMQPRGMSRVLAVPGTGKPSEVRERTLHRLNMIKSFRLLANALVSNQYLTDVVYFSKGHEIHREFDGDDGAAMWDRGGGAALLPEFYKATQQLERSDCRVHTISWASIDDDTKMTPVEDSLFMFANETGGHYSTGRNDVAEQLAEVRSALADTYRIFVKVPGNVEPGMHDLKITTKLEDVKIRHAPHIWVESEKSRNRQKKDGSKPIELPNRAVTTSYIAN